MHDVKHPGQNNAFQVNARTGYSFAHNNESVLENMHVSHAFNVLLGRDETHHVLDGSKPIDVTEDPNSRNVFANMTRIQFDSVRTKLIDAVLHTDMSKHFEFVATMKVLAASNQKRQEDAADNAWEDGDTADCLTTPTNRSAIDIEANEANVWQILLFLLHLADISGQAKPGKLRDEWGDRVYAEFFKQGDQERSMGMPISYLCDRTTVKVADSQVGFLKFVVEPAFAVCGQLIEGVEKTVLPIVHQNMNHWEKQKVKTE